MEESGIKGGEEKSGGKEDVREMKDINAEWARHMQTIREKSSSGGKCEISKGGREEEMLQ